MSDNENSNQGAEEEGMEPGPKKPRMTRSAVRQQQTTSQESSTGEEKEGKTVVSEASSSESRIENDENMASSDPITKSSPPPLDNGYTTEQRVTRGSVQMHPYSDRTIRVGREFQVEIPEETAISTPESVSEKSMCLWTPNGASEIKESELEEFCEIARVQYGYTIEQSLGMLHYHKYNIEKALADLNNFFPQKEEWSTEDKVLFEQAFSFHGKNFIRIKQLLPHKPMSSLVDYYYSWKKTRNYTSYMDNQMEQEDSSDSDSDGGESSDSKKEEKKACENCRHQTAQRNPTPMGQLCNACHLYWKRSGGMRPCKKKPDSSDSNERRKGEKCPKGFDLVPEQLKHFAKPIPAADKNLGQGPTCSTDQLRPKPQPLIQGDTYLKDLECRIYGLRAKAVKNTKYIERFTVENGLNEGIEKYRLTKSQKIRTTHKWTDKDRMLAVQGFRKYGKNFQAVSEIVQTKTVDAVKSFLRDYRGRYGLDKLIEEFEREKEMRMKEMEKMESLKAMQITECIDIEDDEEEEVKPGQVANRGITEEVAGEKMTSEG